MSHHQASVNGSNSVSPKGKSTPVPERDAPWVWGPHYASEYHRLSQDASKAKAERREKNRKRPRKDAVVDPIVLAMAQARHASKQALVDLRLGRGFVWHGGTFAGSDVYRREPFQAFGLVSEQHPILQCFVTKLPRAKRLQVGDHKAACYTTDSKLLGLDAPYVHFNNRVCGALRIELDRVLPWSAIEDHCRAEGAPLPNIVVGWQDRHGDIHRPHLIWLLHSSVPLEGDLCARFRSLHRGVLRGLTKAFLGLGADPGGLMNCHRVKNALSPLWDRQVLAEAPYDPRHPRAGYRHHHQAEGPGEGGSSPARHCRALGSGPS